MCKQRDFSRFQAEKKIFDFCHFSGEHLISYMAV